MVAPEIVRRSLLPFLTGLLLISRFPCPGNDLGRSPVSGLKGLMVPLYVPGKPAPVAVVRIENLRRDYQRKGFFRIGLLPMVIAEGVTIECFQPGDLKQVLGQWPAQLAQSAHAGAAELRRVSFRLPGQTTPRLEAGVAQLKPNGCWLLSGEVRFARAGETLVAAEGVLRVTGAQTGRLLLRCRNRTIEVNLLESGAPQRPSHPPTSSP